MEKLFKLKQNGTTVRTEIIAGLTHFHDHGVHHCAQSESAYEFRAEWRSVALERCVPRYLYRFRYRHVCHGVLANKPFAMAPGMGLNSFFATVVLQISGLVSVSYLKSFQAALCIILIEGIVFLILSVLNVREKIVAAIPLGIRFRYRHRQSA